MASNPNEVRQAAMRELARRELTRRQSLRPGQSGEFKGPIATGEEMAGSRTEQTMRKLGLLETARIGLSPTQRFGLGAAEGAASILTGMVSTPINHLVNAAAEAGEMPTKQVLGSYQPRTPEGQAVLSGVDKAMRATRIPQAIEAGMDLENPNPAVRATGNLIGGVLGVMPAVGPMRAARARRAAIPTRDAIKTAATEAYARAEAGGGMLPQQNLASFVTQAEQALAREGVDKTLHPKTMAALSRLMDDATRPGIAGHSAQGAETLRKVLLNAEQEAMASAAPGTVSSDARLVARLVDDFDDFMEKAIPSTTAEYRTARALWNTQRKAQDVEAIFERAKNSAGQFSMSGMENALTTQFRQLANNPRRLGRFTQAEQDAIRAVARGGPVQNSLRLLGKLAPTGAIPAMAALTAEGVAPGSGFALAAAGLAGRAGATALRTRAARRVDEIVRSGAIPNMPASRIPGSLQIPQTGILPAAGVASNALYREQEQRRNALAR